MKFLKLVVLSASLLVTLSSSALDLQGYDSFGYNKYGYDFEGYNFFGHNKKGVNRQGCHVYKHNNDETLDCSIDLFAEEAKHRPNFLAYQLRRSEEPLYKYYKYSEKK